MLRDNIVDFWGPFFLFHKFSNFTPPPPQDEPECHEIFNFDFENERQTRDELRKVGEWASQ